jgi:hypothetical protein
MNEHITRYDRMPIPPVEAQTTWIDAGAVKIGVEYRLLTDAIAAANEVIAAAGASLEAASVTSPVPLDDRGVSLHVFSAGTAPQEYLRFDCFDEDPHYHYISWSAMSNEMLHLDPIADGDPLAWALERIRTRLPQMLARAGAPEVACCARGAPSPRRASASSGPRGRPGGACPPPTRSTAPPRICRACSTNGSTSSGSTSPCSTRAAGS